MSRFASIYRILSVTLVAFVLSATASVATEVPFTEDFKRGHANWFNSGATGPLRWLESGGPDGSAFVFEVFNFVDSEKGDTVVLFRAQDEFNSSNGAFEGNWIEDNVTEFSAFVKHNAPVPMTFFVRFSHPNNFPGCIAIIFQPVMPNTWTRFVILIDPENRQFVTCEGSDFETVFSNIGHVQIGVSVPEQLAGRDEEFTFSLDKAAIAGGACTGRERLKIRCGKKRCGNRLQAKLKKGQPGGMVTFTYDGGNEKKKTVRDNGKAKVKWCPVPSGRRTVEVVECNLSHDVDWR